jgi:hypothetical protein
MVRYALLATTLALCPPTAGLAEMINVATALSVDPAEPSQDPVVRGRVEGTARQFYTGLRAASVPDPERAGDVDLYVGMRPTWRAVSGDLNYTRRLQDDCCGRLGLSVGRRIGNRADIGARVYYVPAEARAGSEAHAAVTVFRGYRVDGTLSAREALPGADPEYGMNLGVSRSLAEDCDVGLRYQNASFSGSRAEMSLEMDF